MADRQNCRTWNWQTQFAGYEIAGHENEKHVIARQKHSINKDYIMKQCAVLSGKNVNEMLHNISSLLPTPKSNWGLTGYKGHCKSIQSFQLHQKFAASELFACPAISFLIGPSFYVLHFHVRHFQRLLLLQTLLCQSESLFEHSEWAWLFLRRVYSLIISHRFASLHRRSLRLAGGSPRLHVLDCS